MTHRDTLPPILFWIQSRITALIIESFAWFFTRSNLPASNLWLFSGMLGQMALSVIKLYKTKRFHYVLYLLCIVSQISDINISAHVNSFSEPRNWDIQWWQLMREAPRFPIRLESSSTYLIRHSNKTIHISIWILSLIWTFKNSPLLFLLQLHYYHFKIFPYIIHILILWGSIGG